MTEKSIVFAYGGEVITSTSVVMLLLLGFTAFILPNQLKNVASNEATKTYIAVLTIPFCCLVSMLYTTSSIEITAQQIIFHQPWGKSEYLLEDISALNLRWEKSSKSGFVDNYYMTQADGVEISLNFNKILIQEAWPDVKYQASTKGIVISDPPKPLVQCRCKRVE